MDKLRTALRAMAAVLASALIAAIACVLLGLILPVWGMILIYGEEAVESAPAHGAAVLFLTVPVAGFLSLLGFLVLTKLFYRRFSTRGAAARRTIDPAGGPTS